MTMLKFNIPIQKLFEIFELDNDKYEVVQNTTSKIWMRTPDGYSPIIGYVKKDHNRAKYVLEDGVEIKSSTHHKVFNKGVEVFIDKTDLVDTTTGAKRIVRKEHIDAGDVYDVALPYPHVYLTPDGVLHHNTTAARAIAEEVDAEMLYINASLEGNIDTIRTTLTQFVSTVSMEDRRKIVLLDESDYLTCFASEQKIAVVDQDKKIKYLSIGDLENKKFDTLTYDFDTQKIINTEATAFCSGEKELFEVEFEDGTTMLCTEDHPFFDELGGEAKISDGSLFSINIDETDYMDKPIHESNCIHVSNSK
jgi:hypothetical protein